MNTHLSPLHGRLVARGLWLALFGLSVVVLVLGLGVWFPRMQQVCPDEALACQQQLRVTAAEAQALQESGWSLAAYAWYSLLTRGLIRALGLALGALIFWRRPNDPIAFIASLFMVLGLETSVAEALAVVYPAWWLPTRILAYVGGLCFALFFYLFPSGRFVPGWTRWMSLGWAAMYLVPTFFPASPLSINKVGLTIAAPVVFVFFASFGVAQVYRYRVVSTPVERVQTKWVVFATALGLLAFLVTILRIFAGAGSSVRFTRYWILNDLGFQLTSIIVPLAIALAILRYRLWDIDVIIRRTLVYSALTGLLALAYFGTILVLQAVFRTLTGEAQSPLVTVLSTLAIAGLSLPLRRRVQGFIDRRFYRRKVDAARILAAFAVTARDETDLARLTAQLAGDVHETMQPESLGVWLRPVAYGPAAPDDRRNAR